MKLVLGIGNPGEKYENTRHNIGFLVIDDLVRKLNGTFRLETKFESYLSSFIINGEKVFIVKPITYVNLTGRALQKIMNYYKISIEDILIVVDDINLPTGKIRIRESGSDGGHNGLKNINQVLRSKDYKRLRVGIGIDKDIPLNNYVLGKISQSEHKIIDPIIDSCALAALDFIRGMFFTDVMTKYNSMSNKDND